MTINPGIAELLSSHDGLTTVSTAMGTATLQTNQDGVCTFTKALSNTTWTDLYGSNSVLFTAS